MKKMFQKKTRNNVLAFVMAFAVVCFMVISPLAQAKESYRDKLVSAQTALSKTIFESALSNGEYVPGIEDTASVYVAFSLAKAGFKNDAYYAKVTDKLEKELKEKNLTLTVPEYAKIIMYLSATDNDVTNFAGINLVEKMTSREVFEASPKYILSNQWIMVLAVKTSGVKWPEKKECVSEEEMVVDLINDFPAEIQTAKEWDSYDSVYMLPTAFASYTDANGASAVSAGAVTAIKAVNDQAKEIFREQQMKEGGFPGYGGVANVWTLAAAMTLIGEMGVNVNESSDWFKEGNASICEAIANDIDANGKVSDNLMSFQPEQLLRGITSCIYAIDGKNRLYAPNTKEVLPTATPTAAPTATPVPSSKPSVDPKNKGNDDKVVKLATVKKVVVKKAKAKSIKISWKKVSNAKGYVVEYSLKKNFKKKNKVTTKKTSIVVKKLQKGKKYFVRVKAYADKKYGNYSKVASIKVK